MVPMVAVTRVFSAKTPTMRRRKLTKLAPSPCGEMCRDARPGRWGRLAGEEQGAAFIDQPMPKSRRVGQGKVRCIIGVQSNQRFAPPHPSAASRLPPSPAEGRGASGGPVVTDLYAANAGAIRRYEGLGFRVVAEVEKVVVGRI